MGGQPGGEILGALEIEQGFRQGLKLLQGEGLDAGQWWHRSGGRSDGQGGGW